MMREHWPAPEWDGCYLLTNCEVFFDEHTPPKEMDMLVIGSTGVSLIEIKHWDMESIKGEPQWVLDEAIKLNGKARKIKGKIGAWYGDRFIDGRFLFTKNRSEKYRNPDGRMKLGGMDIFGFNDLSELVDTGYEQFLSPGQVESVRHALEPATSYVDRNLSSFGDFHHLHKFGPQTDFQRIFHGRRGTEGEKVIVHLYDLSASQETDSKARAQREYELVKRIQRWISLPRLIDSFQGLPAYPGELYFFSYQDKFSPAAGRDDFIEKLVNSQNPIADLVKGVSGGERTPHHNNKDAYGTVSKDALVLPLLTQSSNPHDDCRQFRGILENVKLRDGLEIDDWGCGSWDEGEPIWVGISKPLWKSSGGGQPLWRIHIEPQFARIIEEFSLKLHYEFDPYKTDNEAHARFNAQEIEQFLKGQREFQDYVWEHKDDVLEAERGWRKVGRKRITLKPGAKVSELRLELARHIAKFAKIIDGYCRDISL